MELENGGKSMKVMVVIDETDCSYQALMWVLKNLKDSVKNSPLVILAPQPPPPDYVVSSAAGFAGLYSPYSPRMELVKSAQALSNRVALGLLEKAESVCAAKGVKTKTITEIGDARELIVKVVQKHNINLLVIGNPDVGSSKRTFLGTLGNYCVKNANCHVLVLKKEECKISDNPIHHAKNQHEHMFF